MRCPRCGGRMLGDEEPSCLNCGYVRHQIMATALVTAGTPRPDRTYKPRSKGYGTVRPGICGVCRHGFRSLDHQSHARDN